MQPTTEQLLLDFLVFLKSTKSLDTPDNYLTVDIFMERFQIPKSPLQDHSVKGASDEHMKFIEIDSDNPKTYQAICLTTQKPCENDLLCNTTCFLTQKQPVILTEETSQPTSRFIAYEDLLITSTEMDWPIEVMEMINKLEKYPYPASQYQHPVAALYRSDSTSTPPLETAVEIKNILFQYGIEFDRIGYTVGQVEENSLLIAIRNYTQKVSHDNNLEIMRLNGIIGQLQTSTNNLNEELKANYGMAQNPFTKRGIKIALKLFSKWVLS